MKAHPLLYSKLTLGSRSTTPTGHQMHQLSRRLPGRHCRQHVCPLDRNFPPCCLYTQSRRVPSPEVYAGIRYTSTQAVSEWFKRGVINKCECNAPCRAPCRAPFMRQQSRFGQAFSFSLCGGGRIGRKLNAPASSEQHC